MNYLVLRKIIELLLKQYRCHDCQGSIGEANITIHLSEQRHVNVGITCPHCGMRGMLQAELGIIPQEKEASAATLAQFHQVLQQIQNAKGQKKTSLPIKKLLSEKDLLALQKKLEKNTFLKDLFE